MWRASFFLSTFPNSVTFDGRRLLHLLQRNAESVVTHLKATISIEQPCESSSSKNFVRNLALSISTYRLPAAHFSNVFFFYPFQSDSLVSKLSAGSGPASPTLFLLVVTWWGYDRKTWLPCVCNTCINIVTFQAGWEMSFFCLFNFFFM